MDEYITALVLTRNLIYLNGEHVWIFPGKDGLCYMEIVALPIMRNPTILLTLHYLGSERQCFLVPIRFWDDLVSWMRASGFGVKEGQDMRVTLINVDNVETARLDTVRRSNVLITWKDGHRIIISPDLAESLRILILKEEQNEKE